MSLPVHRKVQDKLLLFVSKKVFESSLLRKADQFEELHNIIG